MRKAFKFSVRPPQVLGVCLLTLVGVLYVEHKRTVALEESNKNYSLIYATPTGWLAIPHSPQAIFLYQQPQSHLLMRAAMSDVVADYNPSPEMDTENTAQFMLDVTSANLVGWNGKLVGDVDAKGATFRIVRRWTLNKIVYSAVAVRGNTTIIVSLSADKPELRYIDAAMPQFRQYLASLEFRRHIWTD